MQGPSGTFHSTNFPNNYPDNEYCTWKIQVPQGKKVRLDFTEFRTEENNDLVLIYDTDQTEPIVAFSGVKDKPRAITSSGNSVRVRFVSNGQNVNNGFQVSYKQTGKFSRVHLRPLGLTVDSPDACTWVCMCVFSDCGGIYTSQTGEIRSPGFPNQYPPNLSCTWLIYMKKTEIALRLPEFNTENAYDRLEVAHGPWATAPLEIAWSGPSPLYGDVVTKQYMWVHFVTSAQNDRAYKGFRATFKPYDPYAKKWSPALAIERLATSLSVYVRNGKCNKWRSEMHSCSFATTEHMYCFQTRIPTFMPWSQTSATDFALKQEMSDLSWYFTT